jgi:hypothetical protein
VLLWPVALSASTSAVRCRSSPLASARGVVRTGWSLRGLSIRHVPLEQLNPHGIAPQPLRPADDQRHQFCPFGFLFCTVADTLKTCPL